MSEQARHGHPAHGETLPRERRRETTVDVERLAEKVYRLMVAELRLERARGVRVVRRRGR